MKKIGVSQNQNCKTTLITCAVSRWKTCRLATIHPPPPPPMPGSPMPPPLPLPPPLPPDWRLIAAEEALTCLAQGDLVTSLSISSEDHSAGSFLFQKSELAAYSLNRD